MRPDDVEAAEFLIHRYICFEIRADVAARRLGAGQLSPLAAPGPKGTSR